jgi:ABC-type transport system involved in multi-copper enzyme maturation permease subunit
MSTLTLAFPTPRLVSADLLKLRKRRGLIVVTGLITIAVVVVAYTVSELQHVSNSAEYGSVGGVVNLGHATGFLVLDVGVAAVIVAATAAVGDLEALVYRDLVVTGRSRLALYLSRIPAGLLFLLPFVVAAYAIAAVMSVAFAGHSPAPSASLLALTGAWVLLQATFSYVIAFGLACLMGSRSYTIGILLAWQLIFTPIILQSSSIGVVREFIPGAALGHFAPAGLGKSAQKTIPNVPMSTAAVAAVLLTWAVVTLAAGARRDTTRDA